MLIIRLMSGLQASISTHIAKEYFFGTVFDVDSPNRWGVNLPLFIRAVGSHPERLNNLYFAFLFVLRAVAKAEYLLSSYPYLTGDQAEDTRVSNLVASLVSGRILHSQVLSNLQLPVELEVDSVCRKGFDERVLFQQAATEEHFSKAESFFHPRIDSVEQLKNEFRNRFKNISRIMDCVTCEKCKVWGKLQILGLGTAIKILLSSSETLEKASSELAAYSSLSYYPAMPRREVFLNRQEIVALINTLHQFARSIEFAATASDLELHEKLSSIGTYSAAAVASIMLFGLLVLFIRHHKRKKVLLE